MKNFNENDTTALMKPVFTFEEAFSGYPEIMETIQNQGFERPSPIQVQLKANLIYCNKFLAELRIVH